MFFLEADNVDELLVFLGMIKMPYVGPVYWIVIAFHNT